MKNLYFILKIIFWVYFILSSQINIITMYHSESKYNSQLTWLFGNMNVFT